jgi:uncharacterized delta-60 repeat protein
LIVLLGSARRVVVSSVAAAVFVVLILSPPAASGGHAASSAANLPLAGNLDTSFGSRGVVTHSLGSGEYPGIEGIAVQPDGKIVVAVPSTPGDHGLLLARYLPNGSLDSSFGDGGYVETQVGGWAFAKTVAVQPDGKIVVAGDSYQGSDTVLSEFTLARYNPDGSLDTSFGAGGITNTAIPEGDGEPSSDAGADALAVLPGGEILAGGWSEWGDITAPSASFVLTEYSSDGSLDPTFGDDGIVQTQFYGDDDLGGIAVLPGGKIVATGSGGLAGHGQDIETMALARYEPDGALDPTFGNGGKATTAHKLHYNGGPATLQDGKIVVAGFTRVNSASNDFPVLARYEASGRLDPTFGKHGFAEIKRLTGDGAVQGQPEAVVAQSDGKLLIAAANSVVRLVPNGRLDKSFGRGGIVSLTGRVATSALALQTDGKILIGGSSGNTVQTGGNTWVLARLIDGNNCVVPSLRGKTVPKASATLKNSYCRRGRIAKRFSSNVTRGRVISTAQRRGARLPHGAKVALVVSRGKPVHRS